MKDILIKLDQIDMHALFANCMLIMIVILCIWNYAIGLRIRKASRLREHIILLCKDWDFKNIGHIAMETETSAFEWAWTQLPKTSDMVYSPKPLTIGFWLSKEAILKLTK